MTCAVSGCTKAAHTRGWCQAHYKRFTRGKLDDATPLAGCAKTPQQRLDEKSSPEPNTGCWHWYGASVPAGYGVMAYQGRQQYAHRVAWQLANGDIPAGLFVLHRCDQPPCVNVAHLFLGTPLDNMRDMIAKGRARTDTPTGDRNPMRIHKGILAGERNGSAKLSATQVNEIRRRKAEGETQTELATAFGVGQTHISRIVRRQAWA